MSADFLACWERLRMLNRFEYNINSVNKSHGSNIWCMTLTKSYHRPHQLSSMIVPRGWKYKHNFFNILSTVWTKVMAPTSGVWPCRKVITDHISCLPCFFQEVWNTQTDFSTGWIKVVALTSGVWPCWKVVTDQFTWLSCLFRDV